MENKARQMAAIACKALDDKKSEDIKVIDISNVSTVADYFIIANGTNEPHVDALYKNVDDELYKAGFKESKVEGKANSGWILMDYKDIVVHIFAKEDRHFYDLERIWKDGKEVDAQELINEVQE